MDKILVRLRVPGSGLYYQVIQTPLRVIDVKIFEEFTKVTNTSKPFMKGLHVNESHREDTYILNYSSPLSQVSRPQISPHKFVGPSRARHLQIVRKKIHTSIDVKNRRRGENQKEKSPVHRRRNPNRY